MKRIYRSRTDRVVAGVMGGLGEYFNVDPRLFRFIYLLLTLFTAVLPGIVAYGLAILIFPSHPVFSSTVVDEDTNEPSSV